MAPFPDNAYVASLVSYRPSTLNRRWAAGIAVLLLALFFVTLFYNDIQFPALPQFLLMHATTVFILETLTALILISQFHLTGKPYLLVLASGYLTAGAFAILQPLVFPGVFAGVELFDTGLNAALWIWVFWHFAFPLYVLSAVVVSQNAGWKIQRPWRATIFVLLMTVMLVAIGFYLAVFDEEGLPVIMRDAFNFSNVWDAGVAQALIATHVTALLGLFVLTRLRTIVFLWLAIAMLASTLDTLGNMLVTERYTLGWFSARLSSFVASAAVLGSLMAELHLLYKVGWLEKSRMQFHAEMDALTRLPNRRAFDSYFLEEAKRSDRSQTPLALALVDIDHFKRVNDRYGHATGDIVLQHVASILRRHLNRPSDFVARWGGEEFAILMSGNSLEGANYVLERLRHDIERSACETAKGAVSLTVSVGLAKAVIHDDGDIDNLMEHADQALYQAKHSGRNRICLSTLETAA
ncbi:sensor domain-containing diguanylate cyclase [Marinobacter nanhaiticus D15-8W]|uniref:diguanylate cyclase n=1 Tax=Marinobacter nanhaiticus D15-8W TaxID=626887 RepID=N6W1C9_9GAMM|nr:GGDEF domain-containing protein [Marinobacter nanhaiticus]ENO16320.1 GGDEF domain-containing protein [Marinobacter nanhaiticus D15-8W]BES72821.1 sensor domain-containing diguanylate cyclase [Marinobacter nanhaiticus D15-8W]